MRWTTSRLGCHLIRTRHWKHLVLYTSLHLQERKGGQRSWPKTQQALRGRTLENVKRTDSILESSLADLLASGQIKRVRPHLYSREVHRAHTVNATHRQMEQACQDCPGPRHVFTDLFS